MKEMIEKITQDDEIQVKGKIFFTYDNGNLVPLTVTYDNPRLTNVCHIMSGENFYQSVDDGGFIDYDGFISCIYVDRYESNLGLWHKGIIQGKFIVSGESFLDLCKKHEIIVDWANK